MTTARNIQMNSQANNEANFSANNKFEEVAKMTITTNIQGIFNNNIKVLAGIFVGGMMALATFLPGPALADTPASPNAGSVMTSVGMELPDVDDFDTLISMPAEKTILEFLSVDDLDSIPSVTKPYTSMETPNVDDLDSIPSVTKVYTSIELPNVDDVDSLVSGGTAYTSLETANVDDFDSLLKRITVLEFPSDSELV
ncbi:MAG: hypothetical protein H8E48_07685 [Chloroflexi bacterium]|nr:hypothetical protein [Chloroflexota bacterium]